MQSPGTDVEREIADIQRALEDRNNLHRQLVQLQTLTREIMQLNATVGSASPSVESGPRSGNSGMNTTSSGSRPCSCSQGQCRRVCVPAADNSQRSAGTQASSSVGRCISSHNNYASNCCPTNDQSGSTIAQCRVNVHVEEDSSQSSTAYTHGSTNCSSRNSSPRYNQSTSTAQRLSELTLRIMSRGYSQAEDSWLIEMNSLLRSLIQDEGRRSPSSYMSSSGCGTTGR